MTKDEKKTHKKTIMIKPANNTQTYKQKESSKSKRGKSKVDQKCNDLDGGMQRTTAGLFSAG